MVQCQFCFLGFHYFMVIFYLLDFSSYYSAIVFRCPSNFFTIHQSPLQSLSLKVAVELGLSWRDGEKNRRRNSCSGHPFLAILLWLFRSLCPLLALRSWLSFSEGPDPTFCPDCPVLNPVCPVRHVQFRLSVPSVLS